MRWLAVLIYAFPLVGAEEIVDPQVQTHQVVNQRENYFQTSTPYTILPNVSPITGDLIEEEVDLVVAGCEPVSVRRFYNHTALYEPRSGGWRYNPEAFFVANFEWKGQEMIAAVGAANGSITPFKPSTNGYRFDVEKLAHFTPSGQNHPLNTKINYYKIPTKEKHVFSWRGEIIDGSGAKRSFDSGAHCWLSTLVVNLSRKVRDPQLVAFTPNCWTPYQLFVYEERKSNGNIISYTIATWKSCKYFRKPHLLSSIIAYNADKSKVLGSISFSYNKDKQEDVRGITATGSDGRHIALQHQGNSPILLSAAYRPGQPPISYGYQGQWINRIERPDGKAITTEYNAAGKVAAQYAPVGPQGEMCAIGRYEYVPRITTVYDAENNKTDYHMDENGKLVAIATFDGDLYYRIDRFTWDSATGNLTRKVIEDGSQTPILITEYQYDKNHNPILEKTGIGNEWRTIERTFSDDGFNLKLTETDHQERRTCYTYVPNTNLLASELIYEGHTLPSRKLRQHVLTTLLER